MFRVDFLEVEDCFTAICDFRKDYGVSMSEFTINLKAFFVVNISMDTY